MKSSLLLGLLLLATSAPALARDSAHLVCTGYMTSKPGPDNYGFAILFDDHRAEDGEGRLETLSTVWAGVLYQGADLNHTGVFGHKRAVVVTASDDVGRVFFKGKYNLIQNPKTGAYKMQLNGKMTIAQSEPTQSISTTLLCTDISN